jgi:hypothetical protein
MFILSSEDEVTVERKTPRMNHCRLLGFDLHFRSTIHSGFSTRYLNHHLVHTSPTGVLVMTSKGPVVTKPADRAWWKSDTVYQSGFHERRWQYPSGTWADSIQSTLPRSVIMVALVSELSRVSLAGCRTSRSWVSISCGFRPSTSSHR